MTAIEKLLQAALGEEGYLEKRSNADLDSKTGNAGQNNWTKYWRDMHPIFQGQPWCDALCGWCFLKTFGEELGQAMLCGGMRSYYTPSSAQYFANQGRLDKNPQVGDQVFFTKNGLASGCYHTGILYSVNAQYVYTIEGNTSGASGVVDNGGGVAKKAYSRAYYANKMLFGHPRYDLYVEKPEVEVKPTEPVIIKKPDYKVGSRYELTKPLNAHTAPSMNNSVVYKHSELTESLKSKDRNNDGKLDKGSTVQCYAKKKLSNGNVWIKISKVECWVLAYNKEKDIINLKDLD